MSIGAAILSNILGLDNRLTPALNITENAANFQRKTDVMDTEKSIITCDLQEPSTKKPPVQIAEAAGPWL